VRTSVSPAPSAEELAAILAAIATSYDAEVAPEPVSKWSAFGRGADPYGRKREERRSWPARL
jgi:hypothetical protein